MESKTKNVWQRIKHKLKQLFGFLSVSGDMKLKVYCIEQMPDGSKSFQKLTFINTPEMREKYSNVYDTTCDDPKHEQANKESQFRVKKWDPADNTYMSNITYGEANNKIINKLENGLLVPFSEMFTSNERHNKIKNFNNKFFILRGPGLKLFREEKKKQKLEQKYIKQNKKYRI